MEIFLRNRWFQPFKEIIFFVDGFPNTPKKFCWIQKLLDHTGTFKFLVSCCCEWIYRKKELCLDFVLAKLASAFVSSNEICAKILKKSPHISTIHLISADDLKLSIMLCRKGFVCESNFISKRNFLFYSTYRKKNSSWYYENFNLCLL